MIVIKEELPPWRAGWPEVRLRQAPPPRFSDAAAAPSSPGCAHWPRCRTCHQDTDLSMRRASLIVANLLRCTQQSRLSALATLLYLPPRHRCVNAPGKPDRWHTCWDALSRRGCPRRPLCRTHHKHTSPGPISLASLAGGNCCELC